MKQLFFILSITMSFNAIGQVHERWDVKTLTDGFDPNMSAISNVTVARIHNRVKIPVRNTQPRLNFERQIVRISGTITRIQHEDDGDYHIEISDGTLGDSTVVCEAVDPSNAVTATSPYVDKFQQVRNVASSLHVGDKATFTGLLFQDKFHSPSKSRTRNFVEIHPILVATKN